MLIRHGSADTTAKQLYIHESNDIAVAILIKKYHTGYSSALLGSIFCGFIAILKTGHLLKDTRMTGVPPNKGDVYVKF